MIELDYINLTKWFSNLHLDKPSDKKNSKHLHMGWIVYPNLYLSSSDFLILNWNLYA